MLLIFLVGVILGYFLGRHEARQAIADRWKAMAYDRLQARARNRLQSTDQAEVKEALGYVLSEEPVAPAEGEPLPTAPPPPPAEMAAQPQVVSAPKKDLDNTTLLLYFGAFLMIVAIGLFIAFAELSGGVRTLLVCLAAAGFYGLGLWLYEAKPKLKDAGLTFVGIGLSSVPLIGLAFYNFVFEQTSAGLVWFGTSLVALLLYYYTLLRFKNAFMSYLLIASIVSLFMSSVSILEAPVYFYMWALVASGLVLGFIGLKFKEIQVLSDSSAKSAQLLIPLTILASFTLVPEEGSLQLAVTLLLASGYYWQIYLAGNKTREYMLAAHGTFTLSLVAWAYSYQEMPMDSALALALLNGFHAGLLILVKLSKRALGVIGDIGLLSAGGAIVLSLGEPGANMVAAVSTIIFGVVLSVRSGKDIGLRAALAAWAWLPIVFGQFWLEPGLDLSAQAWLGVAVTLPLLVALYWFGGRPKLIEWSRLMASAIAIYLAVSIVIAVADGITTVIGVALVSTALALITHEIDRRKDWLDVAAIFSAVPLATSVVLLLGGSQNTDYLVTSTLIVLAVNVGLALLYRIETSRWISTVGWLILPVALGAEELFGLDLSAPIQLWLYLLVMIVMSFSRAIARGRVVSPNKVPLASLASNSSKSYLFGLASAGIVAGLLAFASSVSLMLGVGALLALLGIIILHGFWVEQDHQYLAAAPLLLQIIFWRWLEPAASNSWVEVYAEPVLAFTVLSSLTAGSWYLLSGPSRRGEAPANLAVHQISLFTAYFAPASVLFLPETVWAMPVGLIFASLFTLDYYWKRAQSQKELIGGLTLLGIWWLMDFLGVESMQAYTHVLAALFAVYAWWRLRQGDKENSDKYLVSMLASATIPLILQALGGRSGDVYGIWLLLEAIGFMLLGIYIKNSLVTKWGLYVAIGSVLYQLRELGWALVLVIALVIIGVAIYRANKQEDKDRGRDSGQRSHQQ